MTGTYTRYPGAQPFSDDDVSRKVFFGRERASATLTDQILANRMVVVYAKSGLGKTSLLNAGVAQRLRDEGFLPLIVRVNDVQRGPFASVLDGIRAAAERQHIEYVPGISTSLWEFFKTVEFWRGDLLLTPVLILDQFEELFTLQSPEARISFLADLGYLVRGVRPPDSDRTDPNLSDDPPALRIVLSLREDYLGFLEEAADRIPQVLDHRFRLAPLTLDAAAEAMTGPSSVDDPLLQIKPFIYHPDAVKAILSYLSERNVGVVIRTIRYIEPFQLQLICQHVEWIVSERQKTADTILIFTMNDIGGEDALKRILREFYTQEIRLLPKKQVQRAARRLCEEHLISPQGRRLSCEESELCRELGLSSETLRYLVDRRLLRSEQRSDSVYYELSHDVLIEPVLATSRSREMILGVTKFSIGLLMCISSILWTVAISLYVMRETIIYNVAGPEHIEASSVSELILGCIIIILLSAFVFWYGKSLYRHGIRTVRRYRRHIRAEPTTVAPIEPGSVTKRSRNLLRGSCYIVIGLMICIAAGAITIFMLIMVSGNINSFLGSYPEPSGTFLEDLDTTLGGMLIALVASFAFWCGAMLCLRGVRTIRRYRRHVLTLPAAMVSSRTAA